MKGKKEYAYKNNIPPENYLGNKMYYDKIIK